MILQLFKSHTPTTPDDASWANCTSGNLPKKKLSKQWDLMENEDWLLLWCENLGYANENNFHRRWKIYRKNYSHIVRIFEHLFLWGLKFSLADSLVHPKIDFQFFAFDENLFWDFIVPIPHPPSNSSKIYLISFS